MNEPIFNSVHDLHWPYTIATRQQWLTPSASNCMVFNFKMKVRNVLSYTHTHTHTHIHTHTHTHTHTHQYVM